MGSVVHLKPFLNRLHRRYNRPEFLGTDPLSFVHQFTDPWDQEAVALVAALLAYGKAAQIRKSVGSVLGLIQSETGSIRKFVEMTASPEGRVRARKTLEWFVHRFNCGEDVVALLALIQKSWSQYGSIGAHFLEVPADFESDTIAARLDRFVLNWKSLLEKRDADRVSMGFFLTAPSSGSVCKRWCMFLRWMGRKDALDPGLWTVNGALAATIQPGNHLRSDHLILPIDTHTGRLSHYLRLTQRKSLNWKAAVEITEALKQCDAEDPTRYDFALSRLGILELCQKKYRAEICEKCQLVSVCRFAHKKGNLNP